MGHIELSRAADLLLVAPASADFLAKMAAGLADDLASTIVLATDKRVLVAPAMNVRMWQHPATQANLANLRARGVAMVGPDEGEMACHEYGPGRLAEPPAILAAIEAQFATGPLTGRHVLVTAGPTHAAAAVLGARVTLISGPVALPDPAGVTVHRVETAEEMLFQSQASLPADAAVFCAAVADWRVQNPSAHKLKKRGGPPDLKFVANPDILATLSAPGPSRPRLTVGFAAETDDVESNAEAKRTKKNCDWVIANDVRPETGIMGGTHNKISIHDATGREDWPSMPKTEVAARLIARLATALAAQG